MNSCDSGSLGLPTHFHQCVYVNVNYRLEQMFSPPPPLVQGEDPRATPRKEKLGAWEERGDRKWADPSVAGKCTEYPWRHMFEGVVETKLGFLRKVKTTQFPEL